VGKEEVDRLHVSGHIFDHAGIELNKTLHNFSTATRILFVEDKNWMD
jgi:hypothetical protein